MWRQRVPEGVLRLPTLAYSVKDRAVRGMPLLHPSLLSSNQYQATLSVNLPSSLSEKANLVSYFVKKRSNRSIKRRDISFCYIRNGGNHPHDHGTEGAFIVLAYSVAYIAFINFLRVYQASEVSPLSL